MSTRTYDLFPSGGGVTHMSNAYRGTVIVVAAETVAQAKALARRRTPINPNDVQPRGIVYTYQRDFGQVLWCGCSGHNLAENLRHGSGVRAIRSSVAGAEHIPACQEARR